MSTHGTSELVRLAVKALETRVVVTVPAQVLIQVEADFRMRAMPQIEAARNHHAMAWQEWHSRKFY